MTEREPIGKLDPKFSAPDATATPWAEARTMLEEAEIFWLSTVRPDGRPHVTPLISVWLDGAPWFVTGPTERKAVNLEGNQQCVLTTGCNDLNQGLDVVVEGVAVLESDEATLRRVADAFSAKYPEPFKFTVRDFDVGGGEALAFRIEASRVLAFRHLPTSSQTGWQFREESHD
jgi:nitroimidazol reductase NimA-like FMN-containing flavoprotein (pyridoxamine 5'-phosphate oxidase superfamily)